jgi:hypothetical protein
MHSPTYTNLHQHKPNITYNYGPYSPNGLNFSRKHDPKESHFDKMCDHWDDRNNVDKGNAQNPVQSRYMARKHYTTGVDLSQIVYSPKANIQSQYRPSYNPNPKHNTNFK